MRTDIENIITEQQPQARVAVAFHDLESGEEVLIRADEHFHPASTIKIAVMFAVYQQVRQGQLTLDEQIPIINQFSSIVDDSPCAVNAAEDSDSSLHERAGQTASVDELVRLMITISSNLATNLLLRRVGLQSVNDLLEQLGIADVHMRRGMDDEKAYALGMNNVASARGLMQMLKLLASGQVVSAQDSREMNAILLEQMFNEGLPAGARAGTPVAHKTGWIENHYHDAGILYPHERKPYVLVVLTEGIPVEQDAHLLVATISRCAWQHVNSHHPSGA